MQRVHGNRATAELFTQATTSTTDTSRWTMSSGSCQCGGKCSSCQQKDAQAASSTSATTLQGGRLLTQTTIDQNDGVITETENVDGGGGGEGGPPDGGGGGGGGGGGPAATPSGCYIQSASFATIPSGAVPATLTGNKLGAAFTMVANFVPRIPCLCACGEYRQYVRGTFTSGGTPVRHSLGGGRFLDPTTFQEDGDLAAGTAYGYHSLLGTKSKFTPLQSNGCRFDGADEPGITGPSGAALAMNLGFQGDLIDTCQSNLVLATSSWSVSGAATVP